MTNMCMHTHVYIHAHTQQLERELKLITEWCHTEEKLEYFRPRIFSLAREEAAQSPKMKQLLSNHATELEIFDSGMLSSSVSCTHMIVCVNSMQISSAF